jgi:hypothetical protein
MPVAFRAVGPRLKADTATAGATQTVQMPAGHAAGDLLLLVLVYDNNQGPTGVPSGWTLLGKASAGQSSPGSTVARAQTRVYYRVATGSTPAATFTFSKEPWPTGSPYVLAFTVAYSGVDPAGPIEKWAGNGTAGTAATQLHPQLATVADQDWLVTLRTGSAWAARTVTAAGGTNTERVDDSALGELFAALYDSAAGLAPGTQTQRSTTSAGGDAICQGGSTMWSLALKPVTAATYALPGTASVTATAHGASVLSEPGGWNLCADEGLPVYRFTIDWDAVPGPLNGNPGFETEGGWTPYGGAAFERSRTRMRRGAFSGLLTTGGAAGPRIESDKVAVVPGRVYRASGWVWSESAMPGGLSFSVNWYSASGAYLSTSANFFTPAVGDWQYADGFFPAPDGAALAAVLVDCGGTPAAGLRVWADDVRLDDWAALSDPASVVGTGEDVTGDIVSDISVSYGRDQDRQLSPAAVGSAGFTLNNSHRRYSPDNTASPLYGDLDPARVLVASVDFNGERVPLFRGRIDDFDVRADFGDRTVELSFLDGLNDLSGVKLSTAVYASRHTGDLVNTVLDLAGWTGGRDIDRGASVVPYWWLEGVDALSAVNDLVKSEGPPAVAYVDPSGTFVFRDRHHRIQRQASRTVRATFTAGALGDCEATTAPDGSYSFTSPFTYSHGWRDIVNAVTFDVEERVPSGQFEVVWEDESTYHLEAGQSADVEVSTSDPFMDAITPVPGRDVTYTSPGAGTLDVLLSRSSGASARLTLRAVGGPVTVTDIQLRARTLAVQRTTKVSLSDPGSVSRHGERSYPEAAPWASAADAEAIANMILLHYARRRPTVQLRVAAQDPAHFMQVLKRTVSDRIHIRNDELGLDDDFFVERVTHTVRRYGRPGRAPVHAVVLGCEQDLVISGNPFTFDQRGSGFDQGQFDLVAADDPDEVFVFDDPVQGQFDRGRLGT